MISKNYNRHNCSNAQPNHSNHSRSSTDLQRRIILCAQSTTSWQYYTKSPTTVVIYTINAHVEISWSKYPISPSCRLHSHHHSLACTLIPSLSGVNNIFYLIQLDMKRRTSSIGDTIAASSLRRWNRISWPPSISSIQNLSRSSVID